MKNIIIVLAIGLLAAGISPIYVQAETATEEQSTAVEVGNKICPVSKEKIGEGDMGEAVKYEYNGKIYNLCCPMCKKDFAKNPEKFAKIAEDEVAAAQAAEVK